MRALVVTVLVLVAAAVAAPAASADYGVVRQFGAAGAGPGQFNTPIGIGVGPDGNVFVTDGLNDRVEEFTPSGTYVRSFGHTGTDRGDLRLPEDALSDGTSLFVTDCYNSRVTAFSLATGQPVNVWGAGIHKGDPSFTCPENLAMSSSGTLYVADSFNHRVVSFDPHADTPTFSSFGTEGTGPGQFTQPHGLQFDHEGNLLVGDDDPHTCTYARIQRFSPTGTYLGGFGSFTAGSGPGQLFCIWDIDEDAAGNVFVSDAAARIYAFRSDGTFVRQASTPGQLGFVIGLDSNSACELYAVDRNNARIVVFGWGADPTCRLLSPAPPPVTTIPKTTLVLTASSALSTPLSGPVRVTLACPFAPCTAKVNARVVLRRGAKATFLGSAAATLAGGRRVALKMRITNTVRRRIRSYLRTHRSLRVSIRVLAYDQNGNAAYKTLSTTIRRAS